jgi:hypothetical protein
MSRHLLNSLRFSGGIVGLCCLSLALAPIAQAGGTNPATNSGANVSTSTGTTMPISSGSGSPSSPNKASNTTGSGNTGNSGVDVKENGGTATTDRAAVIQSAQLLQTRLISAQKTYETASARVAELESQATATPASPQPAPVRFSIKQGQGSDVASCACNNPDVAGVPNRNAELASAKQVQSIAAADLAQAQARSRQFLESNRRKTTVESDPDMDSGSLW